MKTFKIFILFSGNGSNLENLYTTLEGKEVVGKSGESARIEFVGAICNNPEAYGITRCHDLGLPVITIPHTDYPNREEYDMALLKALFLYEPDLIALCGFMRILTPKFVNAYPCVNIHPSFLPSHKGANAIKESFEDEKAHFGGVSVHYVSEELDGGEIILQEKLSKAPFRDLEAFEKAIHQLEYKLYPQALLEVIKERI